MKKQRRKKLAQMQKGLSLEDDEFIDENEIDGLNKEQTSYIIDQMSIIKNRYTQNNQNLNEIEKMLRNMSSIKGIIDDEKESTPKFRKSTVSNVYS